MTETSDTNDDVTLFEAYLNGTSIHATIRFARPDAGTLLYALNDRRVSREDFETVMAACRASAVESTADAVAEEGWLTVALTRIADNLDVEIEHSTAAVLHDAIVLK